jgi:hypothetical protein
MATRARTTEASELVERGAAEKEKRAAALEGKAAARVAEKHLGGFIG